MRHHRAFCPFSRRMLPRTLAALALALGYSLSLSTPVGPESQPDPRRVVHSGYPHSSETGVITSPSHVSDLNAEFWSELPRLPTVHPAIPYHWPTTDSALPDAAYSRDASVALGSEDEPNTAVAHPSPPSSWPPKLPALEHTVWTDQPSPPSIDAALDQAILDSLLQDLSRHGHETSPSRTDMHPDSARQLSEVDTDSPKTGKRTWDWSEEKITDWVKRRDTFKKFGGPDYLRSAERVFPDRPWLRLAKPVIWENEDARQLINKEVFKGGLVWVDLKELPGMRETINRKTPAKQPSQLLPSVRIPAEILGTAGRDHGPYRVYFTDHGYEGKIKRTKVQKTVLEGRPYLGFFGIPENRTDRKFPMYFFGMGYFHRPKDAEVDHLLQEMDAAMKDGVNRRV
ncbi:related to effector family protein Eff1 [Sporisorium reilianum f. sp. reilianum]|uniref:Related to effector family protein Eff1 n=1 Tax=Sporisorium reilianum f. sp. reilianum TaxID=72559 RepID=A0A2N8UCR7_9BASI|nr:related to effector family protein Eff1 [Sporisorium reilianum f. sp. reilianum]